MTESGDLALLVSRVAAAKRILFITGAGLSADSGLPTYRGVGGLYEDATTEEGMTIEEALSGHMLRVRPEICWRHIARIEQACRGAAPNRGHEVIAALEAHHDVVVLTQNVDGFHQAAGSTDVIAIHGDVHVLECRACGWTRRVVDYEGLDIPPRCPTCQAIVRPDVVLFGESLPLTAVQRLHRALAEGFDVIFSVGTSSAFPYIAQPIWEASRRHCLTVELNPGRTAVSHLVDLRFSQRAALLLDQLWNHLMRGEMIASKGHQT